MWRGAGKGADAKGGDRLAGLGVPVLACGVPMARCGARPEKGGASHARVWRSTGWARRVPLLGWRSTGAGVTRRTF
jgi:hypothetical protein